MGLEPIYSHVLRIFYLPVFNMHAGCDQKQDDMKTVSLAIPPTHIDSAYSPPTLFS